MSALVQLGVGFSIGLSGAMIPGPLFFYTVSEVLRSNQRVGFEIVLGHILLESLFIGLVLIGFGSFLSSKAFLIVLSSVGELALIIMGVLIIWKSPKMQLRRSDGVAFKNGAILGGAFFSLISPGFIVWWATIGVSLLLSAFSGGWIVLGCFIVGHWLADVSWYGVVAFSVERGKYYLSEHAYRGIMRVLAVFLIYLGVYFLLSD